MENTDWKLDYHKLVDYVASHPKIRIDNKTLIMIGEERIEFYSQLSTIKKNYLAQEFKKELSLIHELKGKWDIIKAKVIEELPIDRVVLDENLELFMNDPDRLLESRVHPLLMKVFQGIIALDDFEKEAKEEISKEFKILYALGYERWAELCIIDYLDADEVWGVLSKDYNAAPQVIEMSSTGGCQDVPPYPSTVDGLSFERAYCCTYLTSRLIFHSKRYGRYVALRPTPYEPHWWTEVRSKNQEWIDLKQEVYMIFGETDIYPDMLIYVADDVKDLQLVQDRRFLCRPHINVEFEDEDGWFDTKGIRQIKRHSCTMKPKCGTIIISKTGFDTEKMNEAIRPQKIDPDTLEYWPEEDGFKIVHEDPNTWPTEPELNIVPIEMGWEQDKFKGALDEMIKGIPPYPKADW